MRLALLLVSALGGTVPASGATPCLTLPSDVTDIAAVRGAIDAACPCASYDGTTSAKKHAAYVACARAVTRDASDGTPIGGTVSLRPQCRATASSIVRRSDCGYLAAENRNPCCEHVVGNGKNLARIRPASSCASNPLRIRNDCFAFHFVDDACSNDATNSCVPACGDGTKNGTEQCDGGDATQCPGLCQGDCTCPGIVLNQVVVPSPAMPAQTPGSPGVTPTNPKLLTQFGGASFSLNNAIAVRWAFDAPGTPDAILILVPGFEGGANSFKLLAENLLPRALQDHGLRLEVWAVDRRTNQLEDLAGLQIAESLASGLVALDWLFGAELTLTLHPALAAGPNRRAVFYDANADVPFMAYWTNLMFSRDIDALVAAADAAVSNQNVFLGGHSAGTGFTARYAATDFNLTGVGPADPGFQKVRGLVLLEGGGGSTGGTPLTSDSLDRIIAKADGGNFGATRDNAARCVDGTTACTIDTEAVACVGQTPPKCTPAATAYAIVPGLLNARILASGEVVTIQGITDPNTGEGLLTLDQGAPGNNAVAKVPDLATLVVLPKGTAEAGLGSFLDDDGLVATVQSFVSTSLGAPGPTVGGLLTWLAPEDGPMPPAVLPNNGPPPTTLPGTRWGQEKELTRMDRMMTTFYAGPSNFTDWYYPSAGPATTSAPGRCVSSLCTAGNVGASCTQDAQCAQAINLDSTALSIGRGRRDIENMTQAANIDVPVICFGGTNGLTPVPGSYTAFATSIGPCTAPSCTGAPRVVSATTPNPAFPTFGGVNGGFEVYMSEGFSHVDITTAEDGLDNNVVGPLSDFLDRNVQ